VLNHIIINIDNKVLLNSFRQSASESDRLTVHN